MKRGLPAKTFKSAHKKMKSKDDVIPLLRAALKAQKTESGVQLAILTLQIQGLNLDRQQLKEVSRKFAASKSQKAAPIVNPANSKDGELDFDPALNILYII